MSVRVRRSGDRVALDWSASDIATGPDGYEYAIQSEHVRGEARTYYPIRPPGAEVEECPYGYIGTLADARAVCEWHAWVRAGRPTR